MTYPNSSAAYKPIETTTPSTVPWHEYWREQSRIDGTDWRSLLDAAAAALSRFVSACPTCGSTPCTNLGFCRLCVEADARKAQGLSSRYIDPARWQKPPDSIPDDWNEMSVEALMAHFIRARRRDGAAVSTVETLMLGLRERGTKALTEPPVQRRLSDLSEQHLHEVCGRLQRLKPEIARAWEPEEITVLLDAWNVCHG
jgi:hypothetical protein